MKLENSTRFVRCTANGNEEQLETEDNVQIQSGESLTAVCNDGKDKKISVSSILIFFIQVRPTSNLLQLIG